MIQKEERGTHTHTYNSERERLTRKALCKALLSPLRFPFPERFVCPPPPAPDPPLPSFSLPFAFPFAPPLTTFIPVATLVVSDGLLLWCLLVSSNESLK